jgi:hypothetical protein
MGRVIFLFIPPLIKRYRKKRAIRLGLVYKPILPKTMSWIDKKLKKETDGKVKN